GGIDLYLSVEIADEVVETLLGKERTRRAYRYSSRDAGQYRADLVTLETLVDDPPPTPGAVHRDADDDMIVASAVAAGVPYLVTRDRDLLSLGEYRGIAMVTPEEFIHLVRTDHGRLPDSRS